MCNKANLPNRVEKAKAAMQFAKVTQRDKDGKIRSVILPGSEGKRYQVILRRDNRGLTSELLLLVNNSQLKPGYTNQITYHQMAAVQMAANGNGYKVAWCANKNDAERLAKLGGRIFTFRNFDNRESVMYAVIKKEK